MSDAALAEAIRTGAWPRAALRLELDTPERRDIANRTIESTRDPCEAWDRLAPRRAREGSEDDPNRLFHLRRDAFGATPTWIRRRMRASAAPIAMCRSPGVPPAPTLLHPVSTRDAVEFSLFAALLTQAERLAVEAACALDAIGRSTRALCSARGSPPPRRPVWMTRGAHHTRLAERAAVLLAVRLLEQLGDNGLGSDAVPLPLPLGLASEHYGMWSDIRVAAIGAFAWRAAVNRGCHVAPTRLYPGPRFFIDPTAVGHPFADFESPFESLLELHSLGVAMGEFSQAAVVLELCP